MLHVTKTQIISFQFNPSCPKLLKWSVARNYHSVENVCSNKNVFSLCLKMLRVCYFVNCIRRAVPSFRPSMGKTAFDKLQPSCRWFITVSPGRSELDSGMDICGSTLAAHLAKCIKMFHFYAWDF